MAEGRLSTLREVLKPAIIRWGGSALVALGFYDVLCNQAGLPPLKNLANRVLPWWGMTGALMPWWGWLLVLQALFVYALFEYMRVKVVPKMEAVEATSLEAKAAANRQRVATPSPATPKTAPKPEGAKLGAWEHVERFKVSEAANLWANFLPGGSYIYDKATKPAVVGAERLIVSELKDAIDMSDVPGYSQDYTEGTVSRADLLALAERKGVKPVFLYPKG